MTDILSPDFEVRRESLREKYLFFYVKPGHLFEESPSKPQQEVLVQDSKSPDKRHLTACELCRIFRNVLWQRWGNNDRALASVLTHSACPLTVSVIFRADTH